MDNTGYFERQNLVISKETSEKIYSAKILVIGVGAGGNEVLKNLALMGFGNFTLVDFDCIEKSNLSRTPLFKKEDIGKSKSEVASRSLLEFVLHNNPLIRSINAKIQDIGKKIFLEHNIVICCVDTMDARIYINDLCVLLNIPLFEMGFEKYTIQISFFPNEIESDSCLRELIGNSNFSGNRQSCSKLKIEDTNFNYIPTIQITSAFAGIFIAAEIILYFEGKSSLKNKMLQYNAEFHKLLIVNIPQSNNCYIHNKNSISIFEKKIFKKEDTFRDILNDLQNTYKEDYYIKWDDEYIYSMNCEKCGNKIIIKNFKSNVYDKERWCSKCYPNYYDNMLPVSSEWKNISELNLFNPKHKFFLDLKLSDYNVKGNDFILAHNIKSPKIKKIVFINK